MVKPALCGRCGAPVMAGARGCSFCGVAFVPSGDAPAASPPGVDPGVVEALRSGDKIEAIKLYRAAHGTSLKESKDAIDRLDAQLRIHHR